MFSSNTTQTSGGYQISRSLRFNQPDSTYLSRTPASAGSRTTWTLSGWFKGFKSNLNNVIYCAGSGANQTGVYVDSANQQLNFYEIQSSATIGNLVTTQVFRDISAWYHIVVVYDSTQATASSRMRLYVNGSQITALNTATYVSQNTTSIANSAVITEFGNGSGNAAFYDGLMTELYFIDGQALTPSSFGETNAQTGVWQPKAYSGTYGTNGFYLNFSDNSNTTAATLGKDYSGNGNNWTPNNFSVTAGAGNDSLVDSPTSYGTDTGVGGTVRGNYCTLNPLFKNGTNTAATLTNGNLDLTTTGGVDNYFGATFSVSSGKWYYECLFTAVGTGFMTGICKTSAPNGVNIGSYRNVGDIYNLDGTSQTSGATYTTNDLIGVAIDIDAGTVQFYKNGTAQGATPSFTFTAGTEIFVRGRSDGSGASATFNFGQRPFAYTAPSGYKALCTQNLPTPTIGATTATQAGKYFNPVLYTGTGSSLSVSGVGFQPDLVWGKSRSAATNNNLYDAVRGTGKILVSNNTDAENDVGSLGLSAFNSDGFSLGAGSTLNNSGSTYVAWNWKANGSGSTNTAGSITSTVSANTTSGFSVVTYTGTGTTGTIGHGLGVAPSMIIVKCRSNATTNWYTYHISIGNTGALALNLIDTTITSSSFWNNTSPTSSVFTISGASGELNGSGRTYVAYAFAEVAGYSKFGSWTGNASTDGPFVYTGFRPAYVMWKRTDVANDWVIVDATRSAYNQTANVLYAEDPAAENTSGVGNSIDILSNGFKLRQTNNGSNASGGTYIYMCFASNPFKYSLAR